VLRGLAVAEEEGIKYSRTSGNYLTGTSDHLLIHYQCNEDLKFHTFVALALKSVLTF
jgi:hypothetical protein